MQAARRLSTPPPPTSWKLPGLAVRVLAGEGELTAEQLVVGVGRDERLENGLELQRTPTRQRPEKIQSGTASKRRGGANENNVSISSFEAQCTTKPPRPCRLYLPAHPRPASEPKRRAPVRKLRGSACPGVSARPPAAHHGATKGRSPAQWHPCQNGRARKCSWMTLTIAILFRSPLCGFVFGGVLGRLLVTLPSLGSQRLRARCHSVCAAAGSIGRGGP